MKISPNQQKIVSVGEEGGILIWDYRKPISNSPPDAQKDVKVIGPSSPKWCLNINYTQRRQQWKKPNVINAHRIQWMWHGILHITCYVIGLPIKETRRNKKLDEKINIIVFTYLNMSPLSLSCSRIPLLHGMMCGLPSCRWKCFLKYVP